MIVTKLLVCTSGTSNHYHDHETVQRLLQNYWCVLLINQIVIMIIIFITVSHANMSYIPPKTSSLGVELFSSLHTPNSPSEIQEMTFISASLSSTTCLNSNLKQNEA